MIDRFIGAYGFLSNMCYAPIQYQGLTYNNAEAAFQSMKCKGIERRKQFCKLSGSISKIKGRQVSLRNDWESVKDTYMYEIVKTKFEQNTNLRQMLLDTGDEELFEGNHWHDNHFGGCSCVRCFHIPKDNVLGKILMRVRDEIKTNQ